MKRFFKFTTLLLLSTVAHVHALDKSDNHASYAPKQSKFYSESDTAIIAKGKRCKRGKRGKRGPRGPQGIQGIPGSGSSSTPVYGSFYFDPANNEGDLQAISTGNAIPFTGNTQVQGIDTSNLLAGEVKILTSGDYLIQYEIKNLNIISAAPIGGITKYRTGIHVNGNLQNATIGITSPLNAGPNSEYGYIANQSILSLTANDVVTLRNLDNPADPALSFIAPPIFAGAPVYVGPYATLTILKVK